MESKEFFKVFVMKNGVWNLLGDSVRCESMEDVVNFVNENVNGKFLVVRSDGVKDVLVKSGVWRGERGR